MKPEEFSALANDIIANLNDQAKVTTIMATLIEDNNKMNADTLSAMETAKKMTEDNEKLRQANMSLFLKVGEAKPEDKTPPKTPEDNTPKFEDLFDDKGNLK